MATKKKTDCRQYRIGDFARYLGVTAEFLKHYQESGLLDVTQRASGYRYYGFDQSARILQYMRLRNYGISVKEMGPFLEGGLDEAVGRHAARERLPLLRVRPVGPHSSVHEASQLRHFRQGNGPVS